MRPPTLPFRLIDLPVDENEKTTCLADIFGAYLMWNRAQVMEAAKKRIGSQEARGTLGAIFRKPYDDVAALGEGERAAALALAEKCVDDFAILMLALLAHQGVDVRLESGEAVRFPLDIEVVDATSRDIVLHQSIGHAGFLPDNWGRWLNRNPFTRRVAPSEDRGDSEGNST